MASGCTDQNDFQERWVAEYDDVAGVEQVERVQCGQSFVGELDGCSLELRIEPDLTVAQMADLVDDYLGRVYGVYRDGEVEDRRGALALRVGSKQYVFAATARAKDGGAGQARTTADAASLELFRRVLDDERLKAARIADRGGDAETLQVWLQDVAPTAAWDRVQQTARDYAAVPRMSLEVGPAPGSRDRILALQVSIEAGVLPEREWAFVQETLDEESKPTFTARISSGSVHLVDLTAGDSGELVSSAAHQARRERIESRATQEIDVTIGAGRERDARASTTGEVR